MAHVKAFVTGFLATLIFHRGVVAMRHVQGVLPPRIRCRGTGRTSIG